MPIYDDARHQAVVGQLFPNIIGMTGQLTVCAVAEVGAHHRARRDRCINLLAARGVMSNGDDNSCASRPRDKLQGTRQLGSQGHDANTSSRNFLPAAKLIPIWMPYMGAGVSSTWTIERRDIGAFQMDSENSFLRRAASRACLRN